MICPFDGRFCSCNWPCPVKKGIIMFEDEFEKEDWKSINDEKWFWRVLVLFISFCAAVILAFITYNANAQTSWVDQLRNENGNVCCFNYDGLRLTDPDWDTNSIEDHPYKVKREGNWLNVPAWAIVNMKNQDGVARVWYNATADDKGNFIRCFIPGSLT